MQYYFHCILLVIIDSQAHSEFKGREREGCQDQIVKECIGWEISVQTSLETIICHKDIVVQYMNNIDHVKK